MTTKCSMCGSSEINPGKHGRPNSGIPIEDHPDLCDICFCRTEAATWKQLYDMCKKQYEKLPGAVIDRFPELLAKKRNDESRADDLAQRMKDE